MGCVLGGLAGLLLPRPPGTHTASAKQSPIWQWAVSALGQGLAACARLCLLWHEARGCPSLWNFLDFLSCSRSCQGAGEMLFGAHDIKTFHKRGCQEFPQNPFLPLKGPATPAGRPRAGGQVEAACRTHGEASRPSPAPTPLLSLIPTPRFCSGRPGCSLHLERAVPRAASTLRPGHAHLGVPCHRLSAETLLDWQDAEWRRVSGSAL